MGEHDRNSVRPVRTAITGCGGVTADVLEVISPFSEIDVQIVQDIESEQAQTIARRFGIRRSTTEFDEILADEIELVVVNTPNHFHMQQTLTALDAGKHCLVQKPIARTSLEAGKMIYAASEAGLMLGVAMEERGNVIYRQMKQIIEQGLIGKATFLRCAMAHTGHLDNPPPAWNWRASEELIGGGSFIQLGIHLVDLAQWMLGSKITQVSAISSSEKNSALFPTDETTRVNALLSNDVAASFTTSFSSNDDEFFVQGSEGFIGRNGNTITWMLNSPCDGEFFKCAAPGVKGSQTLDWYPSRPARLKPEYEQHRAFALAIRGSSEFEATGEVALKDLLVVEAVHESAKSGKPVKISI